MFAFNSNGNFRKETISTGGAGGDDFSIRVGGGGGGGGSVKSEKMGSMGMKPVSVNTSSGKVFVPQDKKLKFKQRAAPAVSSSSSVHSDRSSSSHVPMDSFAAISNPKSSLDGSHSGHSDDEDETMGSGDGSDSSSEDGYSAARGGSSYASGSSYTSGSGSSGSYESGSDDDSDESGSGSEEDSGSESGSEEDSDEESEEGGSGKKKEKVPRTFEEIQQEKQKLLFELERLQTQGYIPSKRYSMASEYGEMKFERDRLKHMRDQSRSIKWMRSGLISVATGIEWVNKTFNPADIRLDGWSENLGENIHDYDEVFGELHDKYSSSLDGIPPEIRLVGMVAGSAVMYHVTSSFMKKAPLDLQDILKKNPDIARQVQSAAVGEMGNRIDAEFGRTNPLVGSMMKGGMQMKAAAAANRGTMAGPANVDDILNELDSGSVGGRMQSFGSRGGPAKKKGIALNL